MVCSMVRWGGEACYTSLRNYQDPTPDWAVSPQLADVVDNEAMQVYMKPSSHEESKAPSKGFVVRDAPWATVNNEKVSAASATGLGAQGVWHPLPRTCSEVWPSCLGWGSRALSLPWWQRKQ